MTDYHFIGHLASKANVIHFKEPRTRSHSLQDGRVVRSRLMITSKSPTDQASIGITINCGIDRPGDAELFYTLAHFHVRSLLDVMSFRSAMPLTFVLEHLSVDGETPRMLVHRTPEIVIQKFWFGLDAIDEILDLMTRCPLLALAFNDLQLAHSSPEYTVIGCGRALDTLRNIIAPIGEGGIKDMKQSWARFRAPLNLDEEFITPISVSSQRPRHGMRLGNEMLDNAKIATRTWAVMNRLIEFLRRGGIASLPLDEFPRLEG